MLWQPPTANEDDDDDDVMNVQPMSPLVNTSNLSLMKRQNHTVTKIRVIPRKLTLINSQRWIAASLRRMKFTSHIFLVVFSPSYSTENELAFFLLELGA